MAELILVRHGQASAFEDDYDRLNPTGQRQARLLGEYWVRQGLAIDRIVTGSLKRHQQTEAGVRAAYEAAGQPLPPAEIDPDWNEYDAEALATHLAPALAERDDAFRALAEQAVVATGPDRNRYFQRTLEALSAVWIAGHAVPPEVEPFADFHARVAEARTRIVSREGTGRVVVFTSGGPIGVNIQLTLEAPATQALSVSYRIRNGALTHFLFSRGRVSLDGFNHITHLAHDPDLATFR